MKIKTLFFLSILSFFLFSCNEKLEKAAYIKWVQDFKNGLHVTKRHERFIFDVQYRPPQFVALVHGEPENTSEGHIQYYILKISCDQGCEDIMSFGIGSQEEKQRRRYYYAYLFQNDLFLEENGEKFPCVIFHYEQSNSKERTFILGFETKQPAKESTLLVQAEQFSTLPIKIKISKRNIPTLKI